MDEPHWRYARLRVPGWGALVTKHFRIASNTPRSELIPLGRILESTLSEYRSWLGPGNEPHHSFQARYFRWKEEYLSLARARGVPRAESFYDPERREMVLYRSERKPPQAAVRHEFCHQFLYETRALIRPLWFVEGLAELAGRGGTVRFPERTDWLPISRLIRMGPEEFYGPHSAIAYEQSACLVGCISANKDHFQHVLSKGMLDENVLFRLWEERLRP